MTEHITDILKQTTGGGKNAPHIARSIALLVILGHDHHGQPQPYD